MSDKTDNVIDISSHRQKLQDAANESKKQAQVINETNIKVNNFDQVSSVLAIHHDYLKMMVAHHDTLYNLLMMQGEVVLSISKNVKDTNAVFSVEEEAASRDIGKLLEANAALSASIADLQLELFELKNKPKAGVMSWIKKLIPFIN
jgi:hypothetical protein